MAFIKVVPGLAGGSFSSVGESVPGVPGAPGTAGGDPLTAILSAASCAAEAADAAAARDALEEQILAGGTGFQNVISYVATDDNGAQQLSAPDSGGTTTI